MNEIVVTLRDITAKTVLEICDLDIAEEQRMFVAPNAISIAQAHFNSSARFKAVYAGETPVGFVMWRPADQEDVRFLWRFMIDRRYQASGYGRLALTLLFQSLRAEGVKRMLTSYVVGDAGPRAFYAKLGFKETGETRESGERVMDLAL